MPQTYVITWAWSPLWKSLVKYFSNKWCKLLFTSHRYCEDLKSIENENIKYLPNLDLTDENNTDYFSKEVNKFVWNEPFNVLNRVGRFPDYKETTDITINEAKRILESNILCVFATANKLIPIMCKNWGWHFIWFSMHTTYQNFPKMAIFSASKTCLESFIKGLSNEYFKYGVHANIISISTLKTDIELKMKPEWDYDNWLKPEELCKIVDSLVETSEWLVNWSIIHTYKYSDTFFWQSYYDRIKIENTK